MNAPAFTVLMATYGGDDPSLLENAIQSVYENTTVPDEFVLSVDGPISEKASDTISSCQSRYGLRPIYSPENRGLATALNIGISAVETEWIARADSDDINLPDRFSKQLGFLAEWDRRLDLFGGNIQEIDASKAVVSNRIVPQSAIKIRNFARRRNPFNHMTVMYRASSVRNVGGYPNVYLREDYALWALMIKSGARIANMSDILVSARADIDMIRRRGGARYAIGEFDLQKILVKSNIKGPVSAIGDGLIRSSIFLAPESIRASLYNKFLRTEITSKEPVVYD